MSEALIDNVWPHPAPRPVTRHLLLDRRHRLQAATVRRASADLESLLREVDAALERLDDGSYGVCEVCREAIGEDRMRSDPLARVCLECLSPAEQRALEYDLQLASSIQAGLLPQGDLTAAGWQLHYEYQPLGVVSGDYVDLVHGEPERQGAFFFLGDVAGKGVSAAILMAHLHAIFRSLASSGLSLAAMVERANRLFCAATPGNAYATLVCGLLDPSGRVELCNAGHCPPWLVCDTGVVEVSATGMPLGMFSSARFETHTFDLCEDDRLLLYTDGLSESLNDHGEEYGAAALRAIVELSRGHSARATARAVLTDMKTFSNGGRPGDDLTIMVIRRIG